MRLKKCFRLIFQDLKHFFLRKYFCYKADNNLRNGIGLNRYKSLQPFDNNGSGGICTALACQVCQVKSGRISMNIAPNDRASEMNEYILIWQMPGQGNIQCKMAGNSKHCLGECCELELP